MPFSTRTGDEPGKTPFYLMGEMNLYTRPIRENTLPSDGQMQQESPADQIAATVQRPQ
jgi:hypothetical protein